MTRNAEKLWGELAVELVRDSARVLKIVDVKPIPVAKGRRAEWAKCSDASKDFPNLGMIYSFKLHPFVNERDLFKRWSFTPAHFHEARLAPELIGGRGARIIRDKAYLGDAAIITPKRKNMTQPNA